jgi:hypothetical protein
VYSNFYSGYNDDAIKRFNSMLVQRTKELQRIKDEGQRSGLIKEEGQGQRSGLIKEQERHGNGL